MATPAETAYHQSQGEDGRIKGLVLDNLALVNKIADRLAARLGPEVSREELISAGMLGLVEAAHRFDETHNVKFTTFAYRRVRGAMLDLLRQRDWLGRSAREHLDELRDITRRLRSERGRSPTIEELAAAAGLSEEDTLRYLSYERWDAVYSLDQEGPNGEGRQP
ncbi:MAG: sigma-70 family RNA polymerase sigma factor, partial [Candidatus Brocadiia bacterium]